MGEILKFAEECEHMVFGQSSKYEYPLSPRFIDRVMAYLQRRLGDDFYVHHDNYEEIIRVDREEE